MEPLWRRAAPRVVVESSRRVRLVWVARNYAINPAHIVLVFHGNDGHVEVSLVNGQSKSIADRELSDDGRALLLPPESERPPDAERS